MWDQFGTRLLHPGVAKIGKLHEITEITCSRSFFCLKVQCYMYLRMIWWYSVNHRLPGWAAHFGKSMRPFCELHAAVGDAKITMSANDQRRQRNAAKWPWFATGLRVDIIHIHIYIYIYIYSMYICIYVYMYICIYTANAWVLHGPAMTTGDASSSSSSSSSNRDWRSSMNVEVERGGEN